MILDPIAPSFLLVLVFPTCNRFGSKSRIPNFRYYDSQLIPFLLSTLRICFFHQKEVTWVLCLELRTSTSRTGCHAQVLFCSRPHDLLQSLLLDYTTSRLCNSEGPLIPDLMIPPQTLIFASNVLWFQTSSYKFPWSSTSQSPILSHCRSYDSKLPRVWNSVFRSLLILDLAL